MHLAVSIKKDIEEGDIEHMVKNIVFDLGNVLVEFNPKDYMERIGISKQLIPQLVAIIFKDNRWNEFDRGTISLQEYISELKRENPQFAEHFDIIFSNGWERNMFKLKQNTAEFLIQISRRKGIYVLSNVSEQVLNYIKTFDFWSYVRGGTYSYVLHSCKPEDEIYDTFLKENRLNPAECLFLDDKEENIIAAKKHGMQGMVFHDNFKDVNNVILEEIER